MSYFKQSCEYFLVAVGLTDSKRIGERCRAKYARGVNFVPVSGKTQVGITFTPHFFVDPGRYFLTYERMITDALAEGDKLPEEIKKSLRAEIDAYDPEKQLIWLFCITETETTEFHIFISNIKN